MIRWADYLYGEEGSFFIHYGNEGELWEMAEDGRYEHITPEGGMSVEEYRGGIVTPDCGTTTPKWVRPSTVSNWVDPFQSVRIEQVDELVLPYADVAFPSTYFMPEQQNRIDVIEADLNKYMEEMEAAFFAGTKDIDSEYDNFTATLKKMNVEELIRIYQDLTITGSGPVKMPFGLGLFYDIKKEDKGMFLTKEKLWRRVNELGGRRYAVIESLFPFFSMEDTGGPDEVPPVLSGEIRENGNREWIFHGAG